MKRKNNKSIEKQFKDFSKDVKKIKEKSLRLWTKIHEWNSKNDNALRHFEDVFLTKIVSDLRVIQNEHVTLLENIIKDD